MQLFRRLLGYEDSAPDTEASLAAPAHVWCVTVQGETLHAGCADGSVQSWTLRDQTRPLGVTRAHEGTVYALRAWPLVLVSAGADGCVRLCIGTPGGRRVL